MIAISPGHWHKGTGAVGLVDEVTEARRVVTKVGEYLKQASIPHTIIMDNESSNRQQNLNYLVNAHQRINAQLHMSVHFNSVSGGIFDKAIGCEVLYNGLKMKQAAQSMCHTICEAGGFINRGAKKRTDLKWLNYFPNNSLLLEICFVNAKEDVRQYNKYFEEICQAIAKELIRLTKPAVPTTQFKPIQFSNIHIANKAESILNNPQMVYQIINIGVREKAIEDSWLNIKNIKCTEDLLGLVLIIMAKLAK